MIQPLTLARRLSQIQKSLQATCDMNLCSVLMHLELNAKSPSDDFHASFDVGSFDSFDNFKLFAHYSLPFHNVGNFDSFKLSTHSRLSCPGICLV